VLVVVVSVRVDVTLVFVTDDGLKEAVTPVGRTELTLSGDVQESLLPLKPTVIRYVAEEPPRTGLGV
jgi:hypothetical protein